MKAIDMSPQAISRRLKQVDELRELCVALAGSRLKRPWGVPQTGKSTAQVSENSDPYPKNDRLPGKE